MGLGCGVRTLTAAMFLGVIRRDIVYVDHLLA
jgi:hypothetical protein